MADLTITAANVAVSTNAVVNRQYNAGETITAGMCVYLKSTTGTWFKAQADGTAEESGSGVQTGIALHASLAGQPLAVQTSGSITIGATTTVGTIYVVSAAAGGICPWADLVSTNKLSIIGYGSTAAILAMVPAATGVAIP
jgi:hypothetical protein